MTLFNLDTFVENPTQALEQAGNYRKADWRSLADFYDVGVGSAARKEELRQAVMAYLRERGIIEEYRDEEEEIEAGSQVANQAEGSEMRPLSRAGSDGLGSALDALELRRQELQFRKYEVEMQMLREEKEREEKQKQREHELEMARLRGGNSAGRSDANSFVYKAKSLLPHFSAEDPDDFFCSFEGIALEMGWPDSKWPLLVQSSLSGKGLSVALAMGDEARRDYSRLKEEVLKAYQITPEYYRVKFRSARKRPNQKYAELSHTLAKTLDKYYRALNIKTMEEMREAHLLEQFLLSVDPKVKVYLSERQVKNISDATKLAEDYELIARPGVGVDQTKGSRPEVANRQSYTGALKKCYHCGKAGHNTKECRWLIGGPKARAKCYECGKDGHYAFECHKRKEKGQTAESWRGKAKVMCAVVAESVRNRQEANGSMRDGRHSVEMEDEAKWRPYSTKGLIMATDGSHQTDVAILRDTGATHTIIREGALPPEVGEYTGEVLIVKGVGGTVLAPVATLTLSMQGIAKQVRVAVTKEMPIKGFDILLGNDLGSRIAGPLWDAEGREDDACVVKEIEELPACQEWKEIVEDRAEVAVLTRSMAKEEQEKYLESVNNLFQQKDLAEVADTQASMSSESSHGRQECMMAQTHPNTGTDQNKGGDTGLTVAKQREETHSVSELQGQHTHENTHGRTGLDTGGHEEIKHNTLQTGGQDTQGEWKLPVTKTVMMQEQRLDDNLKALFLDALTEEEARSEHSCTFLAQGLLMRKCIIDQQEVHQIVLPTKYQDTVIKMAHEEVSGHLGAKKTGHAIANYFYWPKMHAHINKFCKKCHLCQVVGYTAPRPVPLQPIPVVDEPFSSIVVDIVGPLPRTKGGNEFLLTLMCRGTRYPEAIPISSCMSRRLLPKLMDIFSKFGVPRIIQTDQGSNFMGNLFQKTMHAMGIRHIHSSAYHPQSQGCLERFHRTLKSILTKFCLENNKDWDEGIQIALYAIRCTKQDSLQHSPFELMFGRKPRENLRIIYELYKGEEPPQQLAEYISKLEERMKCARRLAADNLMNVQDYMKAKYDKKTVNREFNVGDSVLVFNPVRSRPLQAKYHGPYKIIARSGQNNYIVSTPSSRKKERSIHVNLLKHYVENQAAAVSLGVAVQEVPEESLRQEEDSDFSLSRAEPHISNSGVLAKLSGKLQHLQEQQKKDMMDLLLQFPQIMSDTPTRTNLIHHDVVLTGPGTPIRQHPYRMSPEKRAVMKREVQYLLDNGLATPSNSPWAAPCLLVPKEGGGMRLCTDYRKLNQITVADPYPVPRIDDLIDTVSDASFLTKIDLLKGFYQVPLTEQAKEASAFITPDGLFQYNVMPFGMRNSGSTFQRLANQLTEGLTNVRAYIDDIVVFSSTWEAHLESLSTLLHRLREANLTINLQKCEFASPTLSYLGHHVGSGGVAPLQARIHDILEFRAPTSRRALRRFLGMAGFYRRFCRNFAQIATPLTDLLSEKRRFRWSQECDTAFQALKALLTATPILRAPDFSKEFIICTDASDIGIGGVLCQEVNNSLMPVAYMSKKLNQHQRKYSVIEKEALAVIQAIEKFEPYIVKGTTIYTDHNPLKFVESMKTKNPRLARWAIILQDKDVKIVHLAAKYNIISDTLSRPT